MESMLMIVTVVSLALGAVMAVVAWRLLRETRDRAAARIEVLQTLAQERDVDDEIAIEVEPEPVRPTRRERLPAPAPPAAHQNWDTDLIRDAPTAAVARTAPVTARPVATAVHSAAMFGERMETYSDESAQMFSGAPARGASSRRFMALGAVGLIIALAAGSVYALHTWDLLGAIATAAPSSGTPPLELLSLRHGNEDADTFVVTGLVENPLSGRTLRAVVAVIYLFDQEGRFLASGRASLDVKSFEPGDESPFVVKIPRAKGVSRYRVGFRFDDGGVVAHVDRRGQVPGGTTEDAIERGQGAPIAPRRSEG